MSRSKSYLTQQLEYQPLRGLLTFLAWAPLSVGHRICRSILNCLMLVLSKRKRLVHSQLQNAFPDKSSLQCDEIAQQAQSHLARNIALFSKIPDLCKDGIEDYVIYEGREHVEAALRAGKGAITFTAHYGCWELMAVYITRLYPLVSMVVRPLDNPMLNQMVESVRASGGGGVIDSRVVFKEGLRLLRNNGILGILVDQNLHKGGVFVDFFGRLAATNTLTSLLARRTGCAVLPMHNIWENGKIRLICEPPLILSQNENLNEAVQEDTQQMTAVVERWIREDPTQWLWLHNRWKRRPLPTELT